MNARLLPAALVLTGCLLSAHANDSASTSGENASLGPMNWTTLLASEDVTIQIIGRLHLDSSFATDAAPALNFEDEVEVRRARIGVKGTLYDAIEYKVEYDLADSLNTDFRDIWVAAQTGIGKLKVGHFKEPIGLEELVSSRFDTFVEQSMATQAFIPARNVGIMLSNHHAELAHLNWAVGVFREFNDTGGPGNNVAPGGPQNGGASGGGEYAVTARVAAAPVLTDETLVHVGFGYRVDTGDDDMFNVRAKPEANAAARFGVTGLAGDVRDTHSIELAVAHGPIGFQTEYMGSRIDDAGPDPEYRGFYVEGHVWLTGESAAQNYKTSGAKFDRPQVHNPVQKGSLLGGAVQLVGRYSMVDLNDPAGPAGAELNNTTLGLNWWLNRRLKLALNWVSADLDGGGTADYFLTRIAFDF